MKSVENMRGFAGVRGDDLGVERRVAIGDMRVEFHARFRAVFGVVVGARLAMSAGAEKLAVRRRRVAVAPDFREGLRMDGVDETGERGLIGLVAHMPFGDPQQPGMAEGPGAAGHAREAEIGGVGEQRRHQGSRLSSGGAPVRRCAKRSAKPVQPWTSAKKLGDAQTRQHGVEPPRRSYRPLRSRFCEWG